MAHPTIQIDLLLHFAEDKRLYRAFDHIIAVSSCSLLVVPVQHIRGSFAGVLDGCPVPWEEVLDLIEAEGSDSNRLSDIAYIWPHLDPLYALYEQMHFERISLAGNTSNNIIRVSHPCGLRFAMTEPLGDFHEKN
ncbi:hypothetical protein LG200_05240 [Methylobacillus caricis]|uniref:hypothetical protein n=1 Tax=Methylobacillus caricis TaxID=1971611 RepID=UPI001CFFDA4B|nr:hypothetical protein [Methylobacillus caricis]MCB5187409.1 hypothetical protein [Methylobacillus caricis]